MLQITFSTALRYMGYLYARYFIRAQNGGKITVKLEFKLAPEGEQILQNKDRPV